MNSLGNPAPHSKLPRKSCTPILNQLPHSSLACIMNENYEDAKIEDNYAGYNRIYHLTSTGYNNRIQLCSRHLFHRLIMIDQSGTLHHGKLQKSLPWWTSLLQPVKTESTISYYFLVLWYALQADHAYCYLQFSRFMELSCLRFIEFPFFSL